MKTLALERDRSEVARRLLTVQAGAAPLWGKMSAHQMVCHLSDSFRMVLGRKAVRDASGFLQRTLVKWTALYFPFHGRADWRRCPRSTSSPGGHRLFTSQRTSLNWQR